MAGGGTERVISTLANYYVDNSYGVSIYMIGGSDIAYSLDERIDIKQLSSATGGSIKGRIARIKALRDEINKYDRPYVIAMGTVSAMFTSLATTGLNCNLIVSERNDPNRLNHRPIKLYERWIRNILYLRAEKIVFQTHMAKDCFPSYIKKKGVIINNPLSEQLPEYNEHITRINRIVYAGRLTEQKNPFLLLNAFEKLHSVNSDYSLEFYGEGELAETLRQEIVNKNLNESAKVCGYTSHLYGILLDSKVYVSCSNWEGISNSLMEAAALGTKIIATDCPMGGSRMIMDMIDYGRLIPPEDVDELYNSLLAVCNEDGAVDEGQVCKFRDELSVNVIATKWLEKNA